ncbi:MAG: hypothetical protein Q8Q59_04250 [Luteolibacter sp.]|jgi:dTDP-4-amino-4,6-dideoxy-D-galactose acyltransferase|nr:hypothetical protein [Luteolibacter sp.]
MPELVLDPSGHLLYQLLAEPVARESLHTRPTFRTTRRSSAMSTPVNSFISLLETMPSSLVPYSKYPFLRQLDQQDIVRETLVKPLSSEAESGAVEIIEIQREGQVCYFVLRYLDWDTKYFGSPVFRIEMVLSENPGPEGINGALGLFVETMKERPNAYFFLDVPSEDIRLIQALGASRFMLIETRLNYSLSNIQQYGNPARFAVRDATPEDARALRSVAMRMRNQYDRVHADPAFSPCQADEYLGTFIEEAIKGFADLVLLPNVENLPPFGFLAGNKPVDVLGHRVSKLVLAAIDNSIEKGWLYQLLSEFIFRIKDCEAGYLTTITQASNRPAIRTWEKAGFNLYSVTHVFSFSNRASGHEAHSP